MGKGDGNDQTAVNTTTLIIDDRSSESTSIIAQSETSLRLKRIADSFTVTPRAKESIAQSQLSQFFEILCVRLRIKLAELNARSRELSFSASSSNGSTASDTSLISSVLSPANVLMGSQSGSTALGLILLSQSGLMMPKLGLRAMIAMFVASIAKRKFDTLTVNMERERCRNVVLQFVSTASSKDALSGLETERAVREVASAISLRHIDQIVPLTKSSQAALADVMVSRIVRHLSRSRFGFEFESRSPLVAALQRHHAAIMEVYNQYLLPQDRVFEYRPLSLLQRCTRALTAEKSPRDDVSLELEPWFTVSSSAPSNSNHQRQQWTASGVLAKTGLRISQGQGAPESYFAHELSDVETYGFAYGEDFERRERQMVAVDPLKPFVPKKDIGRSKL